VACVNASNVLSRLHECDRQTDDRQTDLATEKWIAIGGIAYASERFRLIMIE